MAAATRIYAVAPRECRSTEDVRLVRAATQAQALGHVARATLAVSKPTQDELIAIAAAGVSVEDAAKDEA